MENRLQKISFFIVLIALSAILLLSGVAKLSGNEHIVTNFAKWKMESYRIYIGIAEILLVVALFIPKTRLIGMILLAVIMSGAVYTHINHQEPFYFPLAILIVALLNHFVLQPKVN